MLLKMHVIFNISVYIYIFICIFQMSNWLGAPYESCSTCLIRMKSAHHCLFTIDVEHGLDFVCDGFNGMDRPHSEEDLTY